MATEPVSRSYKNYMVTLLLVILAFNYVDRLALGLVLENIKQDLDLTDTELGFLSGMAFAVFYALMGVPIGWWADRGNRARIITITTAIWSAAVAACGLASTYLHLLLIRIGVGVGEAGCIPPAHALIGDYFTRAERPRAMARYRLGEPLSLVIGYFAAGWLAEAFGWRTMFIVLGLPGVLIALIAWITLKDPKRSRLKQQSAAVEAPAPSLLAAKPDFVTVLTTLWRLKTFRHLLLSLSVVYFFAYGILQWQPTFFIRSFGLQTGELGAWFAVIYGLSGLVGTWLGGELASGPGANNETLQLKAAAIGYVLFGLLTMGTYLSPNAPIAFTLLAIASIGGAATTAPIYATLQSVTPGDMRATALAIVYMIANLIGMGLGPLAAGVMSDALQPFVGAESLRYSLLALGPGYLWSAWHLYAASRSAAQDIDHVATLEARGPGASMTPSTAAGG